MKKVELKMDSGQVGAVHGAKKTGGRGKRRGGLGKGSGMGRRGCEKGAANGSSYRELSEDSSILFESGMGEGKNHGNQYARMETANSD